MDYRNFDLLIEPKENDCYRVMLPPSGIENCLCDNILSAEMKTILEELERSVSDLTPENLPSQIAEGVVDVELMKKFGGTLYECLFRENIRDAFKEAYGEVRNNDELSLRIRLVIKPPEIAQLPWELLYDKTQDLFLCTFEKTSITRYLQIPNTPRDLTVRLPLRILVAIPLNKKDDELDTAAERKIVEDAFQDLKKRKLVEIDFVDQPVTTASINDKLNEKDYHIFHFIGHGCLEGDEGHLKINRNESDGANDDLLSDFQKEGWISADSFANLFTNHRSMKLVVLNSCQGAKVSTTRPLAGLAPRLLRRNIPAVVAMQYPIFDDSALIFSREFYRKLCRGRQSGLLDPAVINARNMILVERRDGLDFATPVLLMQTSSGVIFDLKENENQPSPPSGGGGLGVIEVVGPGGDPLFLEGLKRIGRRIGTAIQTLDEAPRLKAVGEARTENLELLKREKDLEPEASDRYDREIEHEEQELDLIQRRLQTAAKTSVRLAVIAFALGLPMLVAAVFGLFSVVDDWLQQRVWSATRRAAAAGAFGNDQVRVIVADPNNTDVAGFPNPGTPLDRPFHARLIDALAGAGAKVVALDINFGGDSNADAALTSAINRASEKGTQVIVGVAEVNAKGLPSPELPVQLRDAFKDRWGYTKVGLSYEIGPIDRSGIHTVLRHVEMGKQISEGATPSSDGGVPIAPSLMLSALMHFDPDSSHGPAKALFYANERPRTIKLSFPNGAIRAIPVADDEMSFMVTPASDAAVASARRSYQDVLLHLEDREALARDYGGKLVLVGYGLETDRHFISWKRQRYGVEIHANAISNIFQRVYAMKVPWQFNLLIFVLMVLLGYLLRSSYAQKLSVAIGFDSPTLNRILKIPVALLIVTVLYFVVIYFVYSQTVYVVDMTYHVLTLFLAYWLFGLVSRTRKKVPAKEYHLVNAT